MYSRISNGFVVLATCFRYSVLLHVTCNTKFSNLKHSITKVICPANCLTYSHALCGNGVYSRGPICLAAIQDQQIDNTGGFVTVYAANGKLKYLGGVRNGVFSQSCGPSSVSYTFRMTCSTDGNSETEVTQVVCPPTCSKSRVYPCGTEFYHLNSSVCGAARRSAVTKGQNALVTFYRKVNAAQSSVTTKCWNNTETFTFKNISDCDSGHRCENNSTCIDGIMEYFCACTNGYYGKYCQDKQYCWSDERLGSYVSTDGVRTTCDKGWTVFQMRYDPAVDFNRSWSDYETGFGTSATNFWWGLNNLYMGTNNGNCSLRVDLWDFNNNHKFAVYRPFSVEPRAAKYRLNVAGYENNSTAGDALSNSPVLNDQSYSDGMKFSTYDSDNDGITRVNCAAERGGGWWFNACGRSGLNGPIKQHVTNKVYMRWSNRSTDLYPWRKSAMKFRC